MSQAFYRKWRPHHWEQVIGQEHVIRTLQNSIRSGRVGHAYLFAGPRGTGKTSTARLLAKAVNCLDEDLAKRPCDHCEYCIAVNDGRFLDLIEIDAASNTSVEDVRNLRDKINFAPSQGRYKVYIIDEVHMLSTAAFNALLKTLEEPPPHAIFILATTEAHRIPATVLSRCQRHEFRRIPLQEIVHHLRQLAAQEKLQAEPEVYTLIARQSTGSMRDAISLLDQLSSTGKRITLAAAQDVLGTATSQEIIDLVSAIQLHQTAVGLDHIHRALDSGTDPRQFARQVVEYLRSLLLIRMGSGEQVDATSEVRDQMAQHALVFDVSHLLSTIRLFNSVASETRTSWQPGLLLELALTEAIEAPLPSDQVSSPAQVPVALEKHPAVKEQEAKEQPALVKHEKSSQVDKQPATAGVQRPVEHSQAAAGRETSISKPASVPAAPPLPSAEVQPANSPPQEVQPAPQVSLNDLQQNWKRIRALVKNSRPSTEGLLNSLKTITIKEGVLVLGFATEVVRSKMDNRENLELTAQAIHHVLGVNLPITCVVVGNKPSSTPEDLDVDGDGMVGTALNLGGQIVDKK